MTEAQDFMLNELLDYDPEESTHGDIYPSAVEFIESLANRRKSNPNYVLTDAQHNWLEDLWRKYCDDD